MAILLSALVILNKVHAFRKCTDMYQQLHMHSGIEITLAQSPVATGFCFGRAENLENYLLFARMASEEFDLNLYFKKVSCLLLDLLVEVVF